MSLSMNDYARLNCLRSEACGISEKHHHPNEVKIVLNRGQRCQRWAAIKLLQHGVHMGRFIIDTFAVLTSITNRREVFTLQIHLINEIIITSYEMLDEARLWKRRTRQSQEVIKL